MRKKQKSGMDMHRQLFVVALVFIAAQLAASFFPEQRLWGLNQAGFINGFWLLYPVLILFALLVYFRAGRGKPGIIGSALEGIPGRYVPYVIGIVAIAAFYFLRVKAFYLGDSLQLTSNMAKLESALKYREIGESLIHAKAYEILGGKTEADAQLGYQAVSIFAGVIYMAGLIYYSIRIFPDRTMRIGFMVLNLLASISLLFFGYIENYTVTYVCVSFTVFAALAALQQGRKSIVPIIFFIFALFMHLLSLALLPAILIYILFTFFGKSTRNWFLANKGKLLIAIMVFIVIGYLSLHPLLPLYWRLSFLSVLRNRFTVDDYYLTSLPHLIDFGNLLLFTCPILIAATIIRRWKLVKIDAAGYFSVILAVTGIMAAFVIEPKLGMARDWDLMSLTLAGAILAGPYLALETIGRHRKKVSMVLLLVLISSSIFIPWLAVNNSDGALYDYDMQALMRDPRHGQSGMMTMLNINRRAGNERETSKILDYLHRTYPERQLLERANAAYSNGDYAQAATVLSQVVQKNPSWAISWKDLGTSYRQMGRFQDALRCLAIADGLNPYNSSFNCELGFIHYLMGDIEESNKFFERAIKYDASNPETYLRLAEICLHDNKPDSVLYWLHNIKKGLSPQCVFLQGRAWLMKGDSTRARQMFDLYLRSGGNLYDVESVLGNK